MRDHDQSFKIQVLHWSHSLRSKELHSFLVKSPAGKPMFYMSDVVGQIGSKRSYYLFRLISWVLWQIFMFHRDLYCWTDARCLESIHSWHLTHETSASPSNYNKYSCEVDSTLSSYMTLSCTQLLKTFAWHICKSWIDPDWINVLLIFVQCFKFNIKNPRAYLIHFVCFGLWIM